MKILLFDMMNTLVAEPYPASFLWLLEKRGLDFAQFQEARNQKTYLDFESGLIGEYEFYRNYYRSDLSDDLKRRLPRPQKIKKEMFRKVSFLPGLEDFLVDLQERKAHGKDFQTGIASNYSAWYQNFLQVLPLLESSMDYLFFSCELSVRKPDIGFYRQIADALSTGTDSAKRKHTSGVLEQSKHRTQIQFFLADDRPENLATADSLSWSTHLMKDVEGLRKAVLAFLKSG